ncbi:cysteine desulfurase [Vitreoscilla massiliensis]|uniref:cysteine desulfurase n=1 Tax=Vitreoscilla massiliensis TaxID=1689272 RepID=A0ABY4DXC1_9NEIS|nr:family 2A encapsulin nanocompartment cargo protein cysteine desulfurase [Vitreoscilla massiliensis]UOO88166.1 cysteine desulfurase [Vitreoscilla massiliensis]
MTTLTHLTSGKPLPDASSPPLALIEQLANSLFKAAPNQDAADTANTNTATQYANAPQHVWHNHAANAGHNTPEHWPLHSNAAQQYTAPAALQAASVSGYTPQLSPQAANTDLQPFSTPHTSQNTDFTHSIPLIPSRNLLSDNTQQFGFLADTPLGQGRPAPEVSVPNQHASDVLTGRILSPAHTTHSDNSSGFYFAPNELVLATSKTYGGSAFPIERIRNDFPILKERVNGHPLVWLDNAATTHKPQVVIDRLAYFYAHENSNIHRAAHELAARATDAYEHARETVRRFIGAASTEEIIFVRGTTEAINLVANTWGSENIHAGDEIVISHLEHHANIVPWQMLAQRSGAKIKVIPVDDDGQILLAEYQKLLSPKTKLVAITQVSNALGTVTPTQAIIDLAHQVGAKVLVDAAQSIAHIKTQVQVLDADFLVFSGHKVFGPTGIGVVYGKKQILEATGPWQGGNMIADVTFEHTQYHLPPTRFEAGTGNIADAVGLASALEYIENIGLDAINQYEHDLLGYATNHLRSIHGLRLIGTAADKASVLSFTLQGFSTDEVGLYLNRRGIAVRTGHHCAQPILRRFGVEQTVRPSLAFYNTHAEIDLLLDSIRSLQRQRH